MKFEYKEKSEKQLKANFSKRTRDGLSKFISFEEFHLWFKNQTKNCHYCGISEKDVQEIVINGLLRSKRFPENGLTKQGKARGMWLEVDRFDPNELYSIDNCVLACYFCNNDKSDIFGGKEYLEFYQNRVNFLKQLLNK